MRVFLSWSGDRSRRVALALQNWLPGVLQPVQTWLSDDIARGQRWEHEVLRQIQEDARVAIICLTPENLTAPWLTYEVGALAAAHDRVVIPFLVDGQPADLVGPLVQFQVLTASKEGVRHLVRTINRTLGDDSLPETVLEKAFRLWWPELKNQIEAIVTARPSEAAQPHLRTAATLSREQAAALSEFVKGISSLPAEPSPTDRDSVFIVHGTNHGILETVARYVEKIGAAVVVLHEQANEGRTVIEKFEVHARTRYAIVLMSGDDRGGSRETAYDEQKLRARQNVLLELGFFIAKLGRTKVTVLYEEGVEIPSDMSGVLYIKLDELGAWKLPLGHELRTAGIRVDLNKAL
jgi:predicted nucleotide-binding protein